MDMDLVFVVGLVIGAFSIPSLISAFSESRTPRIAALLIVVGSAMVVYAVKQRPNTYSIEGTPDVFFRVVGRYLN